MTKRIDGLLMAYRYIRRQADEIRRAQAEGREPRQVPVEIVYEEEEPKKGGKKRGRKNKDGQTG